MVPGIGICHTLHSRLKADVRDKWRVGPVQVIDPQGETLFIFRDLDNRTYRITVEYLVNPKEL